MKKLISVLLLCVSLNLSATSPIRSKTTCNLQTTAWGYVVFCERTGPDYARWLYFVPFATKLLFLRGY